MNTNPHLEEIKKLLIDFEKDAHRIGLRGDANWTYEIKVRLAALGKSYNYKCCASGCKDEWEPEWLYDLVWYKEEDRGNGNRLLEVPLVLESEWNLHFNFIKYDFEKILLANAPLKVMICQSSDENKKHRLDYFHDAVAKYKNCLVNCTYLIALLDYKIEKFHFETIKK